MPLEEYDIIFIGSGPAGYHGAIRASQLGAKIAIIEKGEVGGTCLNRGCIPSKALYSSVDLLRSCKKGMNLGIRVEKVEADFSSMMAHKDKVVSTLRNGLEFLFKAKKVDLIRGKGKIVAPGRVEVTENNQRFQKSLIKSKVIVIATGSGPIIPSFIAFSASNRILSPEDILKIEAIPRNLLIIGGGAIGVEFASIFGELGTEVTIVEAMDRLLPKEDAEIVYHLEKSLKKMKINILTGTRVEKVTEGKNGARVLLSGEKEIEAELVLVAIGRKPEVEELGLEELGIPLLHEKIRVNERMATSFPHIYACGDVIGEPFLAHVAFAEGIAAAQNALGIPSRIDYSIIPRAIFSFPEIAAVGLTEEEAKKEHPVKVSTFPFKILGKALAMDEGEGITKVIAHAETDKILGIHIIGSHASDSIGEGVIAMKLGAKAQDIGEAIHPHPTLPEAIHEAALGIYGRAIHLLRGQK